MQCAAGIAVQILVLWRSGFQELKRQLATCGGHRMRKQAAVGAQRAEISHDAVEDPAVGPAEGPAQLAGRIWRGVEGKGGFPGTKVPVISQGLSELSGPLAGTCRRDSRRDRRGAGPAAD